jgi:hypothetical protein
MDEYTPLSEDEIRFRLLRGYYDACREAMT